MGTRGLYVFKYRGIYYTFYNHYDSYPSGLGKLIISDIRQLVKDNKLDIVKDLISDIQLRETQTTGNSAYTGIFNCLENPERFIYYTTEYEPECDIFIEYIYIIDFDETLFVIKTDGFNSIFDLLNISCNFD
jgi:hypothetical protein